MREAFGKVGFRLSLSPGSVVAVIDRRVVFAENLERVPHERRFCVIMPNQLLCDRSKLLLIAPCSHRIDLQSTSDLLIEPSPTNGFSVPSIVMFAQIQPTLASNITERLGDLSADEWTRFMEKLISHVDRD